MRERQKLTSRFIFCLHVVFFQTNVAKDKQEFHCVAFCAEFCCAML